MNLEIPDYPDIAVIPDTVYSISLIGTNEFRMGVNTACLKILDCQKCTHIDLTSWSAYGGVKATDFISQSLENPNIIFITFLVPEYYRKQEVKEFALHLLKFNLTERSFRVCEKSEKRNDIAQEFYPVDELPSIKKMLETHIHNKKKRHASKFK